MLAGPGKQVGRGDRWQGRTSRSRCSASGRWDKLQRIAQGEFSAQFGLSLALKDVHLALQAAGDARFAVLACLADEWQQAVDQGLGEQDLTVVTRTIGQLEGPPRP